MLCWSRAGEVRVPSFDHGVGDPVEGDIAVSPSHRFVIVEGNYLLLGAPSLPPLVPLLIRATARQALHDLGQDCYIFCLQQHVVQRQGGVSIVHMQSVACSRILEAHICA